MEAAKRALWGDRSLGATVWVNQQTPLSGVSVPPAIPPSPHACRCPAVVHSESFNPEGMAPQPGQSHTRVS